MIESKTPLNLKYVSDENDENIYEMSNECASISDMRSSQAYITNSDEFYYHQEDTHYKWRLFRKGLKNNSDRRVANSLFFVSAEIVDLKNLKLYIRWMYNILVLSQNFNYILYTGYIWNRKEIKTNEYIWKTFKL